MAHVRAGVTPDVFPLGAEVTYTETREDGKKRVIIGEIAQAWKNMVTVKVYTVNGMRAHAMGVFQVRADGHYRLNGDSSREGPILERI